MMFLPCLVMCGSVIGKMHSAYKQSHSETSTEVGRVSCFRPSYVVHMTDRNPCIQIEVFR
jgi:hypothetical protein